MSKLYGVAALAAVLLVPYAVAQDPRGTLRGTVTDPSGGSIPGVQVRAVNAATGVSASAETNAAGNFNMPFLLPGVYTVSAESAGFKRFSREGIRIVVGEVVELPIALTVGEVSETVEV